MKYKVIDIKEFNDSDGSLFVLEKSKELPFDVKRLFYICNVPDGAIRASHACMNADLLLVPVSGSVNIFLNDGTHKADIKMFNRNKGLYVSQGIWLEAKDFSKDCVLLILSNKKYEECEYIDCYDQYINIQNSTL